MAAVVAPLALWSWVAVQTRADTIVTAESESRHVTAAISEYTLKLLGEQALVLDLVDRQAGNADCATLRADASVQGLMSVAAGHAPQTDAIWIMNPDGFICMSSDPARIDRRDRSSREFFNGARAIQAGGYYVERGYVGLLDSVAKISISKPRTKDGLFNGVLVAAVRIDRLVRDWLKIAGEARGLRINLFRPDGITVARSWQPFVIARDPDFERRVAGLWQNGPQGMVREISPVDGTGRIGSWQALPDWNLVVTTSLDEDAVLRPWRWQTALYGVLAGLAACLLATLTWYLRQIQSRLQQANTELSGLVSERTATLRELETTQERLAHAQRMEALGQLAGGIAHDFNNVLQAVQGATLLIERRADDAERVRSLARMASQAAVRGAAITRRLLAFARRGDLRVEPVDAAALLGGMQEILSHTLGSGIDIRTHTEAALPPMLADKGQLETVLINLASNASDAMQGTGTLTLIAAQHVVRHPASAGKPLALAAGPYIRIAVSDTGMGMTPEVLAKASEPFFTTKQVGQGTGLGLAMARGFAEQSGGRLRIESEPGRGTVVTLWLPTARGDTLPRAGSVAESPVVLACEDAAVRLLLVDDDAMVRETIAQHMEAVGYSVQAVADGEAALAVLDSGEAIDFVISDLSMPGMNGVTLIREAQRRRPALPAILLTGFATDAAELAIGGAMSGAFTLLRKPIEGKILAERVAVMLAALETGQRVEDRPGNIIEA